MPQNKITVLDLFAGCGGLSNGFERGGPFLTIAANEFWGPAADTYERNHPNTKMIRGDVTSPDTKSKIYDAFEKVDCDVIIGGPPCQAYSNAGFRDPDDPRGRLFRDYVEIVDKLKPKVFVMENVKGILSIKHERDDLSAAEKVELGKLRVLEKEKQELLLLRKKSANKSVLSIFEEADASRLVELTSLIAAHKKAHPGLHENVTSQIIRSFEAIGYRAEFKLLNAANFGVPQKRERVIFIGVRSDLKISFPEPTHTAQPDGITQLKPWKTVRDAIDDLKALPETPKWNHIMTKHSEEFKHKIASTPVGKGVFGFSDAFHRNEPDSPSRTVKENHGGVLVHYQENRVMTPRELARLQSFPDDFIFEGSKSQILVQIGNAVPPGLGEAVGRVVAEMLGEVSS